MHASFRGCKCKTGVGEEVVVGNGNGTELSGGGAEHRRTTGSLQRSGSPYRGAAVDGVEYLARLPVEAIWGANGNPT